MVQIRTPVSLLHIRRVAKILDCCNQHVYNLVSNGDLEGIRIGQRALRVTDKSLTKFIETRKIKSSLE